MARPSDYTEQLAENICTLIAEGQSIREISALDGMPAVSTIMRWVGTHKEFQEQYACARELQAEHYVQEILEISDNCTDDVEVIMTQNGEDHRIKQSAIQRARLQVDSRKWIASKLAPKKYGDRQQVDQNITMKHEQALDELK